MNEEVEKVYAVATKWEKASVDEAIVVKRTKNTVTLHPQTTASSFRWRTRIPVDDPCLAPTRAEAIRRAIIRAESNAEYLAHKLQSAQGYVSRLYEELQKEIEKDQPHEALRPPQENDPAQANEDETETP